MLLYLIHLALPGGCVHKIQKIVFYLMNLLKTNRVKQKHPSSGSILEQFQSFLRCFFMLYWLGIMKMTNWRKKIRISNFTFCTLMYHCAPVPRKQFEFKFLVRIHSAFFDQFFFSFCVSNFLCMKKPSISCIAGMKDSLTSFLHKYSYHQVTYLLKKGVFYLHRSLQKRNVHSC